MTAPTVEERLCGSARLGRGQRLARALVHLFGDVHGTGLAGIPASGPTLLAINHSSLLDGPLVFGVVQRPVACLVKSEAFVPGLRTLLVGTGHIEVNRAQVDPVPVRLCLQILRAGGVVGIFPEGTRGDGTVATVRPGVGYFALRTGATVVPIACHGTAEALRTVRRGPIRLAVGAPLAFERYPEDRPLNRRRAAATAELVRAAMAELVASTAKAQVASERGAA
jgi:1-acyl-sn-glycerol-3-phosphate acyltransferase